MVLLSHVRSAFALSNGTYGSSRIVQELRENGLAGRQKRRFKSTTDSDHSWPITPNLLEWTFYATMLNFLRKHVPEKPDCLVRSGHG
jgi:putative transposase